ncbi:ribulose-phosphate 3-epimerase [Candidatus Bathyarchaeota archaeon]|nr:ribulose-phosphate 3-epimerase [Candidatus Bathyarchaeota archaeon]
MDMRETMIVPAIIAQDQGELDELLSLLKDRVHKVMLDYMDGRFVQQRSLDFDPLLPSCFNYEAHLMVMKPLKFLESLPEKVYKIIFHVEATQDIEETIDTARDKNLRIMIALNPETPLDNISHYLDEVDGVLVMTVEPGKYGSEFKPNSLEKVRKLRALRKELNIEVDGGMNPVNVRAAWEAGANSFAVGSYIFRSGDISQAIKELEQSISQQ